MARKLVFTFFLFISYLTLSAQSGNVGIGTNSPIDKLHVYGGNIIADRGNIEQNLRRYISIGGARKDANPYAELVFTNFDHNVSVAYGGAKISSIAGSAGIGSGDLRFFTTDQYTLQERLLIDKFGNVGIGTSNPLSKLHLFGGNIIADRGNATQNLSRFLIIGGALKSPGPFAELYFRNYDHNEAREYTGAKITSVAGNSGMGSGDLRFHTADQFDLFEQMILTDKGNLGISTQSPSELLSVGDDLGSPLTGNRITIGDTDNFSGINMGENIDNRGFVIWDNDQDYMNMGTKSAGTLYNHSLSLKNGNVGVGTNSPSNILSVGLDFGSLYLGNTISVGKDNGFSALQLGENNDNKATLHWNPGSDILIMGTYVNSNNYEETIVLDKGKVGIRNSSPIYDLHVGDGNISAINGSNTRAVVSDNENSQRAAFLGLSKTSAGARVEAQLEANGSNNSGPSVIIGASTNHPLYLRTGNLTRMSISSSGRVTINNNVSGWDLEVVDDAAKAGGGVWSSTSDRRLKKDIKTYPDGLDKILKINPVSFRYTKKSGYSDEKEYVGVIAQELQKISPNMVGTIEKENEEYLTVNSSEMVYMLINSVKELNQKIEELKDEIRGLKEQSLKSE